MTRWDAVLASIEMPDLVSALLGAVVGALAGAVPSFVLAKRNSKELLSRDQAARDEIAKASVLQLSLKLLEIGDGLLNLRSDLNERLATLSEPGAEGREPYQVVEPIVGMTDNDVPVIEPSDLLPLMVNKHAKLARDIMLLQRRACAADAGFRQYCEMRLQWRDIAPVPEAYEGTRGMARVTEQEHRRLSMFTIPMNGLLTSLAKNLEADRELAIRVFADFSVAARPIVGSKTFEIVAEASKTAAA